MAEDPIITSEDILGEFRLVWSVRSHWADVTAYTDDWVSDDGELTAEAEPYLKGYVKWDGCTELDMGRPHWCGPAQYVRHGTLLKHIYHRAFELMGREPEEKWPVEAE